MMRVVRFGDPIGDRELQLMRPEAAGFTFRREIEAWAEIK